MGNGERMTKRYPLRGTFGSGNSGDTRHLQGIALGVLQAADGAHHPGRHADERVCDGGASGDGFGGDVNHVDFAARRIVGKLGHREWWNFPSAPDRRGIPHFADSVRNDGLILGTPLEYVEPR